MREFIGLKDTDGKRIQAYDVLVKHYDAIPEATKEDYDRLVREHPTVTFGYNVHPAYPAHDEQMIVEYDPSMARWIVPRDYNGIPDLTGWRVRDEGGI